MNESATEVDGNFRLPLPSLALLAALLVIAVFHIVFIFKDSFSGGNLDLIGRKIFGFLFYCLIFLIPILIAALHVIKRPPSLYSQVIVGAMVLSTGFFTYFAFTAKGPGSEVFFVLNLLIFWIGSFIASLSGK